MYLLAWSDSSFMPHSFCYLWDKRLIWLHGTSDALIALAYLSIPITLIHFVRKRRDVPFGWIFGLFAIFIVACGGTHIMEVVTLWIPAYWISGALKALTAAVSVMTAVLLVQLIPKALALPHPEELQKANLALEGEIRERRDAEAEVRKLNERLLRHTADLSIVNQELESFAYSVSHDLRAPLRHISGFSGMLEEDLGPNLGPQARQHLQRIQEGTSKMGQLVDELLNLTRIGRRTPNLHTTNLNSIVQEAISALQPAVEKRDIEWKIAELPAAKCDPVLIRQVFQHLLSNALKFTRTHGHAVIEIGHCEKDGRPAIFVRDNGVGFSMKYADKLFGVFQRLHRSEEFEGTGIGLATVQRIIKKHGGNIWVEAEVDHGATFYFTLGASEQLELKTDTATIGA